MTPEEYELRMQRLEEDRRSAHEMVEAGYSQQFQALERLRNGDSGQAGQVSAAWAPAKPARRRYPGELFLEVQAALAEMPEIFDRNHVCKAIGYEPDRGTLHRTLGELVTGGFIVQHALGQSKVATKYRKKEAQGS